MFLSVINLYFGRMWLKRQSIAWAVCCLIAEYTLGQGSATVFGPAHAMGKIERAEINEASGLTAAVGHAHHFWTHNDSGDKARIFLIDDAARHKATYYLQGITARDWEDIGMMERDGRHYLMVGDIGDNQGRRPYIQLHVFEEPKADVRTPKVDTILKKRICSFTLKYEDGPRDAESFFFDPVDKRLYVISKRELGVGVYASDLPEAPMDTLALRKVGRLPYTFITSAAISPDGSEMLIKSLLEVFYWRRRPGESVPEMITRPAIKLPYLPEPQGEAITFSQDGRGYYTVSEAPLGMKSFLYFYPRL